MDSSRDSGILVPNILSNRKGDPMIVCSVHDSKAGAFLLPMFCLSAGVAQRLFHSACNEAGHNFAQYAADYTLFQIGEYDEKTGMIKMDDTFANLGNGASFVNATSLSLVGKPEELPRQMKEEFPISPEEERAIIGDNDNG